MVDVSPTARTVFRTDTQRTGIRSIVPLVLGTFLLTGCGGEDPAVSDGPPTAGESPDDQCYIRLFDGDDLDEADDHFMLTEAGEYSDLDDLPGANQGWTDEADSADVGEEATVEIWSETDFTGESTTLSPGTEHPGLDPEPSSWKMTC